MKKGFTLVELLAVLVLLALIGIIIVPNVLRTNAKAQKRAFEEDIKAILKYCAQKNAQTPYQTSNIEIPNEELELEAGTYTGYVVIEDSNFKASNITNGIYCANGYRNSLVITDGNCE